MTARTLVFVALLITANAAASAQDAGLAPQETPQPPQPGQRGAAPRMLIPRPPEAPRARGAAPTTAVAPVAPAAERRREGQAVNVKVDLVLTDQRGGGAPIKRTVTVLAADGFTGSIRTQSSVVGATSPVPLNVDASPTMLADGKIRLAINLQYDWPAPLDNGAMPRGTVTSTSLHDQLMMILENGKAMIVAQSADPVGDRQVAVEVKATILR
jgi:hypothetical protein